MPEIIIGEKSYTYTIKKKRIRRLTLRLAGPQEILITSPFGVDNNTVVNFIKTHSLWILHNSSKLSPKKNLANLETVSILGENYQVLYVPSLKDRISFTHNLRIVTVFAKSLSNTNLDTLFAKYFKPLALKLITKEVNYFAHQYKLKCGKINVRTVKSRFGSCSSTGNLSFSWQIIFFPYDKFQHIILHELAHLTHHNHSVRFWKLLWEYDRNIDANRRWIRKEANKFLLF